eukprot:scaffold9437_cov31-Attheya_sp.AAC.4
MSFLRNEGVSRLSKCDSNLTINANCARIRLATLLAVTSCPRSQPGYLLTLNDQYNQTEEVWVSETVEATNGNHWKLRARPCTERKSTKMSI